MENVYAANASEKVKTIVARIQEKTAVAAYKLMIRNDYQPDLFDSKFGGIPYWDLQKEYPLDSQGQKMMLLAQINFTKAALEDERLPKQGMLQFFLSADNEEYGIDWEEADSQKDFRVVYHQEIDTSVRKEQILAMEIPDSDKQEYSPVLKEVSVNIVNAMAAPGSADYRFENIFSETVKELYGEDMQEQGFYDYLSEEDFDYLLEACNNEGHWILGYPHFTQNDPREYREDHYYDTLLLQIDSEMTDEEYVMWGDCGVANFFINGEALQKRDFSKVLYNWDCY